MSGLTANQAFKDAFARLKNKEIRYFIARVEGSEIVIEKEGEPSSTFEEFKASVPKEEPRFLLYDYEKKLDDGQNKSKMIFALYCPDSLPIAKKIPYTSSTMSMQGAAPHTSHMQVGRDTQPRSTTMKNSMSRPSLTNSELFILNHFIFKFKLMSAFSSYPRTVLRARRGLLRRRYRRLRAVPRRGGRSRRRRHHLLQPSEPSRHLFPIPGQLNGPARIRSRRLRR